MTPIQSPDGFFNKDKIITLFLESSALLESEITKFIHNKLFLYNVKDDNN